MADRVLLMSIDTLRSDAIGVNPFRDSISRFDIESCSNTPTLDLLCSLGTLFPNCQAQAPYTTASHGSMLTGCWPYNHGIREYFFTPLRAEVQTLFTYFKRAGYVTILATDFPTLIGPILGFTEDVDHYVDEDDDVLGDLLRQHSHDKVFCFWHFADPHLPYGMSGFERDGSHFRKESERVMQLAEFEPATVPGEDWLLESNRSEEERELRLGYYTATEHLYDSGQYDLLMDLYLRGVERFDQTRLTGAVETLRSLGWMETALIAVTGDHGEEHSARGYEHFNSIWNGVTNVPLLFIGSDVPENRIDPEMVRSIDIAPTLLQLAGIGLTDLMDGISLYQRLRSKVPLGLVSLCEAWFGDYLEARDYLNACHAAGHLLDVPSIAKRHLVSVRDGRWKYLVHRDLSAGTEERFLFDCLADVNESEDVKDRFPRAAESLSSELAPIWSAATRGGERKGKAITADIASGLIDMGYLRR